MKNNQNVIRETKDIKDLINRIAPEKVERALFLIEYMVETSVEEGCKLVEYSNGNDVTLDAMVEWVRCKKTPSLSGVWS